MSFATKFFGDYYQYMEDALNALALQQKAIANNISNADNPNYHPVEVSFENQLQNMLAEQDSDSDLHVHLHFDPEFQPGGTEASFRPQVVQEPNQHVDLNYEMAQLAKTQILYDLAAGAVKPGWTKFVIETMIQH